VKQYFSGGKYVELHSYPWSGNKKHGIWHVWKSVQCAVLQYSQTSNIIKLESSSFTNSRSHSNYNSRSNVHKTSPSSSITFISMESGNSHRGIFHPTSTHVFFVLFLTQVGHKLMPFHCALPCHHSLYQPKKIQLYNFNTTKKQKYKKKEKCWGRIRYWPHVHGSCRKMEAKTGKRYKSNWFGEICASSHGYSCFFLVSNLGRLQLCQIPKSH